MRKLTPNMVTRLAYAADLVNYAEVRDLSNVHRTEAALAARGLADFTGPRPVVSADGFRALAAAGFVVDEPAPVVEVDEVEEAAADARVRAEAAAMVAVMDEFAAAKAPAAVEVTPGCEGGMWCRCPKSTPCYPARPGLEVAAEPAPAVEVSIAETLAADILDLVEEFADADIARAAEVAAELDDEQVDAGEFRRLLDDPAVWRRALVSLQAHGIEVDTKVVEELRRATFGS